MARLLALAAALAALLLTPASAPAAWTAAVSGEDAILTSDAAADVVVVGEAGGLLVHGLGGQPGFESNDDWDTATAGVQTALAGSHVVIAGNDGDDRVTVAAAAISTLTGGAGDDTLTGSPLADELDGGDGSDRLLPGPGADTVAGGPGADVLRWLHGDGSDAFDGGGGTDRLEVEGSDSGDALAVRATATGIVLERTNLTPFAIDAGSLEEVLLRAHAGADTVTTEGATLPPLALDGGPGDDQLAGGPADDVLDGGGGGDALDGGAGADLLLGGDGDDRLALRDGVAETGRCGGGSDTAVADAAGTDTLVDCEAVDRPAAEPPPAGPPVTPPATTDTVGLAPRLSFLERIRRGRVRVRVKCRAAETGGCQGRLTLTTAGRVRLGRIRAVVVLAETGFSLAAGASTRLVLELPRGWRRLLRRKRLAVRATAQAADAFSNHSEASVRATLRR